MRRVRRYYNWMVGKTARAMALLHTRGKKNSHKIQVYQKEVTTVTKYVYFDPNTLNIGGSESRMQHVFIILRYILIL